MTRLKINGARLYIISINDKNEFEVGAFEKALTWNTEEEALAVQKTLAPNILVARSFIVPE